MRLGPASFLRLFFPFFVGLLLSGCSPLIDATIRGNSEGIRALLDQGIPVDQQHRGLTALMVAAREGRVEIAEYLLDKGAHIDARDPLGRAPLHHAVLRRKSEAALALIKRGADVNARDGLDRTPLMCAAQKGDVRSVKALLEAGARLEDQSSRTTGFSGTALMFAAYGGQLEAVKTLLDAGASSETEDPRGKNAAYWARVEGNREVAALLKGRLAELATERERLRQRQEMEAKARDATDSLLRSEQMRQLVKAEVRGATGGAAPKTVVPRSDVEDPKYQGAENSRAFAVVVGVERYSDVPPAQYAARDAEAVTRHLLALGYPRRNVITLTESRAVQSALRAYLEKWLPSQVTEDSTVFFYFSGHGSPDLSSQQAYLLPWDSKPEFLKETSYPLKRLYESLNALKAKRVIVVLDACFSGLGARSVLAPGLRPLVNKIERPDPGKIAVLSATSDRQAAVTLDQRGHGALTYYFLKGLNGSAVNGAGQITMRSLYDYLSPKVQDAARERNQSQTPVLWPESGEPVQITLRPQ